MSTADLKYISETLSQMSPQDRWEIEKGAQRAYEHLTRKNMPSAMKEICDKEALIQKFILDTIAGITKEKNGS